MRYLDHTTGPNERWDHLAYRYYGDANRTSPIIRANRDLFIDTLGPIPTVLPVGRGLRIPILDRETIPETSLPPWKRGAP
jgi:hypothetical protein